jgi:hypothetical protein
MKKIIFLFLVAIFNLNSATHTVTSSEDAGSGSLREIVAMANANDTIIFADGVDVVWLTTSEIDIDKTLTISGGSGERMVSLNREKTDFS